MTQSGNRFEFAIPCDRLQMNVEGGPDIWMTLMLNARRIEPGELLEHCSTESLLEDGESYSDFVSSDPDSGCYVADVGGERVYFIQTAGFEFFFTHDGKPPSAIEPASALRDELYRDSLARVLLPANCPLSNGSYGFESQPERIADDLDLITGKHQRFRFYRGTEVVGAMHVVDNTVDQIYVRYDYRRQGIASELFARVRTYLGDLNHSGVLTDNGRQFAVASSKRRTSTYPEDEDLGL